MRSSLPSRSGCRGAGQRSWPGGGPGAEGPPWRGVHSRAPPRPTWVLRGREGKPPTRWRFPRRVTLQHGPCRGFLSLLHGFPAEHAEGERGAEHRARGREAEPPAVPAPAPRVLPSRHRRAKATTRGPHHTLSSGAVTPRAGSRFDAVSTFGRKAAGPWHAVFLTLAPAGFTTLAPCRLHRALGLAPTLLSQQAAWLPAPVDPFPLTAQVPGSSLSFLTCHLLVLHFLC